MKTGNKFGIVATLFATIFLSNIWNPVYSQNFEFTSFTVIESIIPNGVGRSRILSSNEKRDYKEFTTTKSAEDNSRNKSDRGNKSAQLRRNQIA